MATAKLPATNKPYESLLLAAALAAFLAAVIFTLPLYGPGWDSTLGEFYFGDRMLRFWQTFDVHELDWQNAVAPAIPPAFVTPWVLQHPEHISSFGPTMAAVFGRIFGGSLIGAVEARHLWIAPLLAWLAGAIYFFVRKIFGTFAAAIASASLLVHPRLWGDAHNNIKDVPAMVFFSLAILAFFSGTTEKRSNGILFSGFFAGLSLAAKPNALLLPLVLLPWLFAYSREHKINVFLPCVMAVFVGIATFLLFSPWLLTDIPRHLLLQFGYFFHYGLAGPDGWSLLPIVNVIITTPLVLLLVLFFGLLVSALSVKKSPNGVALLLLFWITVPILRVSLPRANDFDGIRHYWEFWPAAAIIIGIGAEKLCASVPRTSFSRGMLALVMILPPVIWITRNPADGICFYNSLIGGLGGAQEKNLPQATDYWGSSYRRGIEWLNTNAAPNSAVAVAVAPHIVQAVAPLWLRPDIQVLDDAAGEHADYQMFITRKERYPAGLADKLAASRKVYEIQVDGGAIMQILSR